MVAGMKAQKQNFELSKNIDIFNSVVKELNMHYVDTVKNEKIIHAGINGMLNELDPYTVYFSEDESKDLKMFVTGKYAGMGAIIRYYKAEDRAVISEPYEDMPALVAGVKAGDVILSIDGKDIPKIHPAQKPVKVLKKLIETFTDPGDVVIDPCFGSGSTGRAAMELGRNFYGFEINKEFYRRAKEEMCVLPKSNQMELKEFIS